MKKPRTTSKLHAQTSVLKKERKSDLLRRTVIDTFIALVGKIGFESTTLDRIAQVLRMRRNHVGYYFPSRNSLLSHAVERVISLGQQITVQKILVADTPEKAIEAWVGSGFDWLELFPHHGKVMLAFYSQCPFDTKFAKLNSDILELGVERLYELLVSQGFSVRGNSLKVKLREIQTFNLGAIIQHLTSLKPESWPSVKARAISHAHRCLK